MSEPVKPPLPQTPASMIDGLANTVISGSTLRSMFVMLTRAHYSSAKNFGLMEEKMRNFVWNADAKKSPLFIDCDYNYQADQLDRRPAIFVGVDDMVFTKAVVGNTGGYTEDRAGHIQMKRGQTAVILRHIGKTATDSMLLAEMSQQFYQLISPLMLDRTRFTSFEVAKISSSRPFQKTETAPDKEFASDLILAITYTNAWLTLHESHPIKTVGFVASLSEFRSSDDEVVYPKVRS